MSATCKAMNSGTDLSWLEDGRISSGQAGSQLPCQHHQGVVPWHDKTNDTNGLAASVAQVTAGPGMVDRNGFSLQHTAQHRDSDTQAHMQLTKKTSTFRNSFSKGNSRSKNCHKDDNMKQVKMF